ncbi:PREDICTED: uncharacterized protein LOC107067804 [Polistes dominula]|uniref:inositol-polyphosphate 5-phosphatase n=1 Tax=Polistes dominula TaxID=743375 RepID=A0ABM1IFY3_POLDO|nr:PREDICTED: uncharacterized protein LOC107067804 [Polistes dominula]
MATIEGVPILLITANVGSIFEEPSVMLKIWTEEFLSTISRLDPKFIALHCQEVGGKNYEQSMRHVEDFVRLLMSSEELRLFDKTRVFLDEDYSSAEHFTALGNFYFIHESLKDVLLWDFKECVFAPVFGKEIHSGNIEAVTTKEKAKFPQDFFPECKWSRKGYLRTRWSISGTVFDLINIHLFHDASNFIAMETFPSVYSKTRRRALEHTLDRFHSDKYPKAPYFLFGDFNFRTDTAGVIKKLTEDTQEKKLSNKGNVSKLQFHNKENDLILSLGKKEFSYYEHQNVFVDNSGQWLREYDKELEDFEGRLFEFPINFIPSYPFQEDVNEATSYMQTRVPAWCDRVLLSPTAKMLVQNISSSNAVEYGIIGRTTCMGDHKPVYLRINLASVAGMINCCSLPCAPEFCFQVPDNYLDLLPMLPDCTSYVRAQILCADRSSNLLHAVPIKHDPYTPDSMDSPSPNAILLSGEIPDLDIDQMIDASDSVLTLQSAHSSNIPRRIDRAVSPALLKSKLELIARDKKREADMERRSVMKKNSSQGRLRSWPEIQEQYSEREKRRYNSDILWQRSSILTEAWIKGKGQQGYHHFYDSRNFSTCNLNSPGGELIIPRIAIINASNIESNESSVYLNDNKCNNYLDSKSSIYSSSQTNLAYEEPLNAETRVQELYALSAADDFDSSKQNEQRYFNNKSIEDITSVDSRINELTEETCGENIYNLQDIGSNVNYENQCSEMQKSSKANSIVITKNVNLCDSRDNLESEEIHSKEFSIQVNSISKEECRKHERVVNIQSQIMSQEKYDGDIKTASSSVCRIVGNDLEILRCESKLEMASKNTTRSNSIKSQDISDNTGNVRLKLKAYKVTQKYKNNIVQKQSRCQRCCCVIS